VFFERLAQKFPIGKYQQVKDDQIRRILLTQVLDPAFSGVNSLQQSE